MKITKVLGVNAINETDDDSLSPQIKAAIVDAKNLMARRRLRVDLVIISPTQVVALTEKYFDRRNIVVVDVAGSTFEAVRPPAPQDRTETHE